MKSARSILAILAIATGIALGLPGFSEARSRAAGDSACVCNKDCVMLILRDGSCFCLCRIELGPNQPTPKVGDACVNGVKQGTVVESNTGNVCRVKGDPKPQPSSTPRPAQ
jgi:hypothetical protein